MPKSSLKKWFYPFYKNAPPYYKKGQSGFFFFNRKEKKKVCAIFLSHPTNLNSIQNENHKLLGERESCKCVKFCKHEALSFINKYPT